MVRESRYHEGRRLGVWLDAQLTFEELPASVIGAHRGRAFAGRKVGADQESVGALSERIEADGFGGVTRCESRVALGEPDLAQTFERAEPNISQSPAQVIQPFALVAGQQRPGSNRARRKGPGTGGCAVAVEEGSLRPMDHLSCGIRVQPGVDRQAQLISAAAAEQSVARADVTQRRSDLAEQRPESDLPCGRPLGSPQVVGQIRLWHGFVDCGQPHEEPSDLATRECPLAYDDSVRADDGNAAGEVDAELPGVPGLGRQRFANHAA